jgi:hypothetical protein
VSPCQRLHAFADGEVPPEARPAFLLHLGGCLVCQDRLANIMILDALAATFAHGPGIDLCPGRFSESP